MYLANCVHTVLLIMFLCLPCGRATDRLIQAGSASGLTFLQDCFIGNEEPGFSGSTCFDTAFRCDTYIDFNDFAILYPIPAINFGFISSALLGHVSRLQIISFQFSCSVVSDSLRPHESQHARPPCPSPTPRVYSNSCPSSQ